MEGKQGVFTIQVLSKQINTGEELLQLCKELETLKQIVHNVTFTGNSYGYEACAALAHILEDCKKLTVNSHNNLRLDCEYE